MTIASLKTPWHFSIFGINPANGNPIYGDACLEIPGETMTSEKLAKAKTKLSTMFPVDTSLTILAFQRLDKE